MATDFQNYGVTTTPAWLQRPFGKAWSKAVHYVKDVLADRMKQAVKARFAKLAPSDALAILGRERQLERALNETDAAYAARLQDAWNAWPNGGTAFGLLKQLLAVGYTPGGSTVFVESAIAAEATLDVNGNWANPNNAYGWTFDPPLYNPELYGAASNTNTPFWSKFLVLVVTPFPAAWGGTPPGNGSNDAILFRRIITSWKAAHATCTSIVLLTSGYLWDFPRGRTWATQPATWTILGTTVVTTWTFP